MPFLKKNINKFILLIPALFLAKTACADGGLPLWINTASFSIGFLDLDDITTNFLWTAIFLIPSLLITVFLETAIMKAFCFKNTVKELFKMVLKANIYSTFIGIILLALPLFFNNFDIGYLRKLLDLPCSTCSKSISVSFFLFMHLALFVESCLVEYFVVKKYLIKDSSLKKIKVAIIVSNIVSYIIMPFIVFFLALFILLLFHNGPL